MAATARGIAERNRHVLDRAFAALDPLIDRAERVGRHRERARFLG